jgi:hypothetical protein
MMHFETHSPGEGDGEGDQKLSEIFGPQHVDQFVRQSVQHCWMCLPTERRTLEELEKQLRRVFERALKDFREDREAFGR